MAVRCADLTEDRPYDTLATLEVPAEPGSEKEAFEQLLARADELHANLVIDLHVVPDEQGPGKRVIGAAIKYR